MICGVEGIFRIKSLLICLIKASCIIVRHYRYSEFTSALDVVTLLNRRLRVLRVRPALKAIDSKLGSNSLFNKSNAFSIQYSYGLKRSKTYSIVMILAILFMCALTRTVHWVGKSVIARKTGPLKSRARALISASDKLIPPPLTYHCYSDPYMPPHALPALCYTSLYTPCPLLHPEWPTTRI
jgi:hypothetical protein